LRATSAEILHGGDQVFYSPSKDMVQLPHFGASKEAPSYYATALHELGLLDGRKIRLDRDLSSPFGDHTYAAEELVAELTSAFLRNSESKANSDMQTTSTAESRFSAPTARPSSRARFRRSERG
jgi:antirestriction protein ArdC